jgi:SEC-C motif domain protein
MQCPCGNETTFEKCCGPFLAGETYPETAEALMRSRYTAFVRADLDYIEKTMAPEAKDDFDREQTRRWAHESKWKGLKIVDTEDGGPNDKKGMVEFIATYELEGEGTDHHEVALFRRDKKGHWVFVGGEAHTHKEGEGHHHEATHEPVLRSEPKVGRNDPCPCGSGKKFKKCCALS